MSKKGFVYLITDGVYTKIGITKNSVGKRNKQHQTGNPNKITTVYTFKSKDMFKDESYLHKKYKHRHIRGEWYYLTDSDIDSIVNEFPDGNFGEAYLDFKTRIKLWLEAIKFLILRK